MGSSNGAGLGRYSFLSSANWSRIHIMFGRKSNWLITLVVSAPIVKILDSENAYLPSFDLKTTKRQLFHTGTNKIRLFFEYKDSKGAVTQCSDA